MYSPAPRYVVGIDLGTTHTVVAYADLHSNPQAIKLFPINQLVAPGQVATRDLLPSVRYHPAPDELSKDDLVFSAQGAEAVLGEAARLLGAKSKGRFVASAKSWLSHPSVDHSADILPWGSHEAVAKVSPIAASASYLAHIRHVWQHQFPEHPLAAQDIVITVPASFDEAARAMTLAAAELAGLAQVRLLEEPQAVCYDWLRRHAGHLQQALAQVHLLLVCDVGGGTTDFTLIKIGHGEAEPKLTRIGVGDHLMLGGDNIDLALARLVESRLEGLPTRLSATEFPQLLEQCRIAKERLLADNAPEQLSITLLAGGSKLFGHSRTAQLSREEVQRIAVDGFFPLSGLHDGPDKKRSGMVEFGLPYAAEPAISKHIAAFLHHHAQAAREALNTDSIVPDGLLLNGGVFRSQPISERCQALLASWGQTAPVLLDNPHPELAVAFGAVSYALNRREKKLNIGGGSARSYFLLVDADHNQQQGICILPKGSEEGEEVILTGRRFVLRLGQPVRFHLASYSGDSTYAAGEVTAITDSFHALPPLAVALENHSGHAEVEVQLAVTHTEVGTLKMECVALDNPDLARWKVEFQLRKNSFSDNNNGLTPPLPAQFAAAADTIAAVFGTKSKAIDPKAVKNLRGDLEKVLGLARDQWPTPLVRALFAVLLDGLKYRRRSANHERIWLSLAGFCLRPGFGYPLDDWRVQQLWKTYPQGLQFVNESQNWSEWWTLWRRIAGGLPAEAQTLLFNDIGKFINPATARQPSIAKLLKTRSYDDIVRLAAVLERLSLAQKCQLGGWLLKRLEKASEPEQTWWAVGRIGARMPYHGSSHNVVDAETAALWLKQILAKDWKKNLHACFAAALIARMSGDRGRDIDDTLRQHVIDKLKASKAPLPWVDMVSQVKTLDEKEEKQIFGEALPPGLKLIDGNL